MFFLVSTHNLITTNFKLHLLSTRIHACIYLGLTVATCDTLISRRPLERPKTDHHRSIISITPYVLRESKKIPISQKSIDPKLYVIFTLSFSSNLNELTSKESKSNASLSLEIYSTRMTGRGVCEIYFDQQV